MCVCISILKATYHFKICECYYNEEKKCFKFIICATACVPQHVCRGSRINFGDTTLLPLCILESDSCF